MKTLDRIVKGEYLGIHYAVTIFIATTILWIVLRHLADASPIWAISSMIAASDPRVATAIATFWGRIGNALIGCAIGLTLILIGGSHEWTLPLALSIAVLISMYVIRIPVMWRQAPITAAIVIAGGITRHSRIEGAEDGLKRVGEVMLGCVVGLAVSWLVSKVWPIVQATAPATDKS